jgi:hypothetical protein
MRQVFDKQTPFSMTIGLAIALLATVIAGTAAWCQLSDRVACHMDYQQIDERFVSESELSSTIKLIEQDLGHIKQSQSQTREDVTYIRDKLDKER